MQGHKDSHETTALSKARGPDERTDDGGESGERRSTEQDAASTSSTAGKNADAVLNPAADKCVRAPVTVRYLPPKCKHFGGSGICADVAILHSTEPALTRRSGVCVCVKVYEYVYI